MFKKITLLILMVFNLNFYTQVVIKDEIDLDAEKFEFQELESAGSDSLWLNMPFHGKVEERVYYYSIACSYAKRELIVDGANYPFGPCWNYECGVGSCFCTSGYSYKLVENVTLGASINTRFQKCRNWGQPGDPPSWGDMQHYFMLFSATQTKHTYYVYARYTDNDPWQLAAYLYLTKTTPPPCAYAQICSTAFTVTMPDTLSVNNPFTFTDEDECAPYYDFQQDLVIPMSVFNGIWINPFKSSNILNLNSEDHIEVCFDLQTQKWKFNLLVENIFLNYAKDLCLNNIQNQPINATPIYNLAEISQLSPSQCSKLKSSIKAHKEYPFTSDFYNGYYFVEIVLTHETEHQKDWEGYIRKYIDNYFNIPEKINYRCEDFSSNQQVRDKILRDIKTYFTQDFWNPYREAYSIGTYLTPNTLEVKAKERQFESDLHDRESIQIIIQKYEDEINKLCDGN